MTPSPDLKARVLAAVRSEPAPTRSTHATRTIIVVAVSSLVALAVFFALGGMHFGLRPLPFVAATVGGWAAFSLAAAAIAFGRGRSMLGRAHGWLLAIAIGTPFLLSGWMLLWNAVFPEAVASSPERAGYRCLLFTITVAALPLLGLAFVRRELDPVHPAAAGAARGVALGVLVGVLVDLWCPTAHPAHVAIGHIAPLLLLALLGGLVGWRRSGVRLDR